MNRFSKILSILIVMTLFVPLVSGANDPGHDSLYIERAGDNVSGTFNFSGTFYVPSPGSAMEAATRQYVDDTVNAANDSIWNKSGSDIYYAAGNVSVGDNTSSSTFSVGSSSQFKVNSQGQVTISNNNEGIRIESANNDAHRMRIFGGEQGNYLRGQYDSETVFDLEYDANGDRQVEFEYGTRNSNIDDSSYPANLEIAPRGQIGQRTALFLDNQGNVGVGTDDPGSLLHLNDSSGGRYGMQIGGGDTVTYINATVEDSTGNPSRLTIGRNQNDWNTGLILEFKNSDAWEWNVGTRDNHQGGGDEFIITDDPNLQDTYFMMERGTGNTGLSIPNPSTQLAVNGTGRFYGNVNVTSGNDVCIEGGNCLSDTSTGGTLWTNVSGNATYTDGNVGIGTTSPQGALQVEGGNVYVGDSNDTGRKIRLFAPDGTPVNISAAEVYSNSNEYGLQTNRLELTQGRFDFQPNEQKAEFRVSGTDTNFNIYNKDLTEYYLQAKSDGSGVSEVLFPNGNVGISKSSANKALDVDGSANISDTVYAGSFVGDGSGLTNISSSGGSLWTNSSGNATYTGGNVGLGITNTTAKLDVNGSLRVRNASGNDIFYANKSSGNVGIGTYYSNNKLDVQGSIQGGTDNDFNVNSAGDEVSIGGGNNIFLKGHGSRKISIANGVTITTNDQSQTGPMTLESGEQIDFKPSGSQAVRFTSSGNVGIGTTSPSSLLDVSGTAQASTSFETGSLTLHNSNGLYRGNNNRANVRFGSQKANGARPLILASGDGSSYTDGEVNINVDGETKTKINATDTEINNDVNVNGSVTLDPEGTKPSCTSSNAGEMWFDDRNGSNGNDDLLYTCMENSTAGHNWVLVARGG